MRHSRGSGFFFSRLKINVFGHKLDTLYATRADPNLAFNLDILSATRADPIFPFHPLKSMFLVKN